MREERKKREGRKRRDERKRREGRKRKGDRKTCMPLAWGLEVSLLEHLQERDFPKT